MATTIVETLRQRGHGVRVSGHYEMAFDPVASEAGFAKRNDPNCLTLALGQKNGVKSGTIAADVKAEAGNLLWYDLLKLSFPVFWFSTPAILKDWIDQVFESGAVYCGIVFYDRGRLAGREAKRIRCADAAPRIREIVANLNKISAINAINASGRYWPCGQEIKEEMPDARCVYL